MEIIFRDDIIPDIEDIIALYENARLPRPMHDKERIILMYKNADIVVSAWGDNSLIGISRALTDFCWCCYLADLAVKHEVQAKGIGKKLIELTREAAGKQSMILLLSVSGAMEYYPKAGFMKVTNGFVYHRAE